MSQKVAPDRRLPLSAFRTRLRDGAGWFVIGA